MNGYAQRKQNIAEQMRQAARGESVALQKDTSNLFRAHNVTAQKKIDVRPFNHVLNVDTTRNVIEAEGMTTYDALVRATLKRGVVPAVVPQLKSITIGGAISGIGIESSSFQYGLVHETVQEMDVLVPSGDVITATPDNEHRDLFFGMPNSYGTLGYILKLTTLAVPAKPYVRIRHEPYSSYKALADGIRHWTNRPIDFIDGTVFGSDESYLTVGTFADEAPYTSDYTYKHIYYKSIRKKREDILTTYDYLWRWDTDWFWCSKNLYMQNPIIRALMGKRRLNSITYTNIMRWNSKYRVSETIEKVFGRRSESVIQDVAIPIDNVPKFLSFLEQEIGITPVWVCPVRPYSDTVRFPLFPMEDKLYANIGFWDSVRSKRPKPDGYYNKKVEAAVGELNGIKSLYSSVFYDKSTFWSIYNKGAYDALKATYDPDGKRPSLYDVVVKQHA